MCIAGIYLIFNLQPFEQQTFNLPWNL